MTSRTGGLVCCWLVAAPRAHDRCIWSSPSSLSMVVMAHSGSGIQQPILNNSTLQAVLTQKSNPLEGDSPSLCIICQMHPGPWAKTIPQMHLPFLEAGLVQIVFPNTFLICTTGTLSPSMVCEGFDRAEPAWLVEPLDLTNQVDFTKCVYQCLKSQLLFEKQCLATIQ